MNQRGSLTKRFAVFERRLERLLARSSANISELVGNLFKRDNIYLDKLHNS